MADKFYGDFYADAKGVEQVGKLLTRLVNFYVISMDPSNSPTPYFEELMGNWIIPSMQLELGKDNPVFGPAKREGKPKYVARVIQHFHLQLMGMMNNIELVTTTPEENLRELIKYPETQQTLRNDLETRAAILKSGNDSARRDKEDASIIAWVIIRFMDSCHPDVLPKLTFNLTDVSAGVTYPVTIDNTLIRRQANPYYGPVKYGDEVPLACIAYSLLRATKKRELLPDLEAPFIRYFAGVQEGLATSMKFLLASLNPHLPGDKTIHNYLAKDGKALTKVVRDEAHHLQMLFATRRIEGKAHQSIGQFIKTANIDPFALSLKPEFLKRDVACLIDSTRVGLHNSIEALDESMAPGPIEIARRVRDSRFSTTIEQMEKELKGLADNVYRCSSKEEIIELLKANSSLLKDADTRAKTINSEIFISETDFPNITGAIDMGLNIIRGQLLPDLVLSSPSECVNNPASTGYALKKPSIEIIRPS